MPSVPAYDSPQVASQALQSPDLRSVASPEVLGGEAAGRMELAKGTLAAGTGLAAVGYAMRERETADNVFRAETKLKDDYVKQEQLWRNERQGRFAKNLTQDADTWFADQMKETKKLLADDPEAQRLFDQKAARLRTQALHAASSWETEQMDKAHDQDWLASKGAAKGVAAANPSEVNVGAARLELQQKNAYMAARKGWGPDQLKGENLRDLTDLHKQVIQQIAQSDPAAAASYFEKYKGEIDGTQQAEIGGFAKKATATARGETAADDIWSRLGPKLDTDAVELDKMEAEARKAFKDDEFSRKAAIQALKERAASHNSSQAERAAVSTNAVMEAYRKGTSMNAIERMPEWNALPGAKRAEVQAYITDRNHMLWARSEEDKQRAQGALERRVYAGYHTYSDPTVLVGMTRAQVQALEPAIGPRLAGDLLNRWDALRAHQGALSDAKVDNDAFKAVLREFNFDPDKKLNLKKEGDAVEAARMGQMRNEVERALGQMQKEKNRPLTREEKDAAMRQVLSSSVLRSTWYAVGGVGADVVPAASIVPQDLKRVVVPSADKEAIVAELKKRSKPVTDEEIARWYLRAQQRQSQ